MSDWSSYRDDKQRMESWRQFLTEMEISEEDIEEGIMDRLKGLKQKWDKWRPAAGDTSKGLYGRSGWEQDLIDDPIPPTPDPVPEPTPDPTPDPTPPTPEPAEAEEGMPISGTEFATMNFLVGGKLLNIIRDAAMVGAAASDPESRNLQQLFNKEFFPALVKMTKNPNIDIAEGIDMEQFLQEMLIEDQYGAADADSPLTGRQQSTKKGQKRAQGGMQRYLKPMGTGKPPMIANKISRALTKALSQKTDAESLLDAVGNVSSTIKNPKERDQYEKRYLNLHQKSPEKRVANYKQNVAAFVGSVSNLASKAAAKALAAGGNFAADKASRTASQRAPAPAPAKKAAPDTASTGGAPSARSGRSAMARMRARDRSGTTGVYKGVTESKKTWKISKDGSVARINNEEK